MPHTPRLQISSALNVMHHQSVSDHSVKSGKNTKKRIVTSDAQTYAALDVMILAHINSGDVYARLSSKEQTVCLNTIGYRVPLLSLFPNVTSFAPGPRSEQETAQ